MPNAQNFDFADFERSLRIAIQEERSGQTHGRVGVIIRGALPDIRARALRTSRQGVVAAKRLSRDIDKVMTTLHGGMGSDNFAICAVGGYGRDRLAPYSDIDLLFLHKASAQSAADDVVPLLYPLWDSGLKIGHSVHTPASAVEFAKADMVGRTAFLDARFLCGDEEVFTQFANEFEKLRKRTVKEFVAEKLKEQDERQIKMGETRYLVEPDIKNSKGGLRDLHTIYWIYKYAHGFDFSFENVVSSYLNEEERRSFLKAGRFLWSVRVWLHEIVGRASDQLTFDLQPEIAAQLGYADRPGISAAERLMKHYFINAVEVGRLTRVLCARLEAENTKRLPRLPTRLPKELQSDEAAGAPNIRIRNGRLDFQSAAKARRNPRDFFRLFRAFSKSERFDFHPDALALISANLPKVTTQIRRDPVIARLFLAMFTGNVNPERTLRLMAEAGLLGKFIPAFGKIVGRIHYGLYRRYTIDEQVLKAIGVLYRIRAGALSQAHPISTRIMQEIDDPLPAFVATLFHEVRWTVEGRRSELSEKLVRREAQRLGFEKPVADCIASVAANHLEIVRTAERRNLTDINAIIEFSQAIGDRERLDLALVLTVCHLRVVGSYGWDNLTAHRLTDLYDGAAIWFEDGDEGVERWITKRAKEIRKKTKAKLAGWSTKEADAWLSRIDDESIDAFDAHSLARFAQLARGAEKDGVDAAVRVTPTHDGLEVVIYGGDRPGLLADIAGEVAMRGLNVRSVRALTAGDGNVFDVFVLRGNDSLINDGGDFTQRLHQGLLEVARHAPTELPVIRTRVGDRRSLFSVEPAVRIEADGSDHAVIVETEGLDRPGLLHELTRALSDCGVAIVSAHIATYGERAVDAFYLQTVDGKKVTDKKTLKAIERSVMKVLSAGSNA